MQSVIVLQSPDARLWTVDNFLAPEYCQILIDHVQSLSLAIKPPIVVYGKPATQNRDIGFFSDSSAGYNYSKQVAPSQPLTPVLRNLIDEVNKYLNTDFNGILINRYNDGRDYLGPHSDDERGLARGSIVAGISLGASRTFRVRPKEGTGYTDVETKNGQLLVMDGEKFQKTYTHEIPKRLKVKEPRISLTFRKHV